MSVKSVVKPRAKSGKGRQTKPPLAKGAKKRKISFGTLDAIRTVLELQAGSLKIRKLTLETDPSHRFRPTIHVYMQAPIGSMKSTLAGKIADRYNVKVYSHGTLAGLVGGVFGGHVRPGHAWRCKNKPLILDEFDFRERSEIQRALLQILDPGEYTRNLYCKSKKYPLRDKDLFFKVNRDGLTLKTRVAGLFLTMRDFSKIDLDFHEALLDRCMPIKFNPKIKELDQLMDTGFYFNPNKYNPPEKVTISKYNYHRIRNYLKKKFFLNSPRHYVRSFSDCLRAYAITGKHDFDLYDLICKLKIN